MFKDKNFWRNIIAGIFVYIIISFFQPILSFLWGSIVDLSVHTYSGYIDIAYANAALGKRDWIGFITFSFFIFLILYLTQLNIKKHRDKLERFKDEKKMALMTNEEKENFLSKKVAQKAKELSFTKKYAIKLIIVLDAGLIIVTLLCCQLIFLTGVDLQLNTSFSQRCTVLAPYIDDQTEKILQSKWASMKSRNDYLLVNQYLDSIAKSKNVVLPDLLLK